MGGKSAKIKIPKFNMSLHLGICHGPVDSIKKIWVGQKLAWKGDVSSNTNVSVSNEGLFGGIKKEGGVKGIVEFMLGGPDQVVSAELANRLARGGPEHSPGFRGIASLFFRGSGSPKGFYWCATSPYMKEIWITVQRCPLELDPDTAKIPRAGAEFSFENDGVWKYRVVEPADGGAPGIPSAYKSASYDDSGWAEGQGGFGSGGPGAGLGVRTYVPSGVANRAIWIRKTFAVDNPGNAVDALVDVYHDDGGWLWWNGESIPLEATSDYFHSTAVIPAEKIKSTNVAVVQILDAYPGGSTGNIYAGMAIRSSNSSGTFDANPAHVIYECLTNTDWGMGSDVDNIDIPAFQAVAQTLYDERFGIFMQWQQQSTIEEFINDILDHIKGAIFAHPRTGKLSIKLLRDDYDPDTLPVLTVDNCNVSNFSRKNWGETSNEIVVTWTNPENEQEETVYSQDIGNIAVQGALVSDSRNYYGVRTAYLAQKLADRELRSVSSPLCACEVTTDRTFWEITPFDCVKLSWPEYGIQNLVMRVFNVDYGKTGDSAIKLSLTEDVFGVPFASFVSPAQTAFVPQIVEPLPIQVARLISLPAYAVSRSGDDLSLVAYPETQVSALAEDPTGSGSASYDVLVPETSPSGALSWEPAGDSQEFETRVALVAELVEEVVSTGVSGISGAGVDSFLIIGNDEIPENQMEIALVTAVDAATGNLTLIRGALDTTPRNWPIGTTVWVTSSEGFDVIPAAATDGQTLTVKMITSTTIGATPDSAIPSFSETVSARSVLPLRPANVKVDGVGFGIAPISPVPLITITWNHRNRLLEDNQVLQWDDASVPPESGVTYVIKSSAFDSSLALIANDWLSIEVGLVDNYSLDLASNVPPLGSVYLDVRVYAKREGMESWRAHSIMVYFAISAPTDLTGSYAP